MKRSFAAVFLALLIPAAAAADMHGWWTARKIDRDTMQLEISRPHGHHSETMKIAAFSGLPASVLDATARTPVTFALKRDAGTLAFEGSFKDGDGAGQFTFTPDPSFVATFKNGGVDDEHLLTMAMLDVSSAYVRSMRAAGYPDVTFEDLVAGRIHKVTPEFIAGLKAAGYDHVPFRKLVAMRIHGIDANYVRRMNALQ